MELNSFSARGIGNAIVLSWRIEGESSVIQYYLRRREGTGEYWALAKIPGSVSSPSSKTYSYIDEDVTQGYTYYYKLGMVKTNGNTQWYGPVSAGIAGIKGYLKISPNPFGKTTVISFTRIVQSAEG
ncbi:hypothetical protein KAX75_12910, partial [candidate division WOR-3 bacterium]|nr:hypothetical protein [candidate division WOR-3 bacterium]